MFGKWSHCEVRIRLTGPSRPEAKLNTSRVEPPTRILVDGGFTQEEQAILSKHHQEAQPQGEGSITRIYRILVATNDRPPRDLDELIRIWNAAVAEAELCC